MRSKPVLLISGLIALFFVSGCANSGAFLSSHQTSVELSEANYKIVATDVTGSSSLAFLMGASYSFGAASNAMGIFRVEGTGAVYQEALSDLWNNVKATAGSTEGEPIALANVRYDSEMLNLFFYTKLTVNVRADVIRFQK
ncbi:MAG: hypothetical protein K9N46_16315 [Candidatus Marinimicrobia bacterium]|nr:hypothetical protein [Candidatus Neomarinimicrobiota bacterium]MCF7830319.1 hypothetical protein [Candidatus Neomarinimicrobiota bacterium]MCF7882296.1 hypothetical protein [Candidatus Neomarinimicrobiota bacterium]